MTQKAHVMHGRDHLPDGADPIPNLDLLLGGGSVPSVFTAAEAYVTIATPNWWQGVMARVQPAAPGELDGAYTFLVNSPSGNMGIWTYIQADGNISGSIALGVLGFTLTAGDKLGITCQGDQIKAWVYHSGTWTNVLSATDSTWSSGHLGIYQIQRAGRLDDFGGGVISAIPGNFTTSLLDRFNRPDEDPLDGSGNWTQRAPTPLKLVSNEVTQSGATDDYASAYWTPTGEIPTETVLYQGADGPEWVATSTLPGLVHSVDFSAKGDIVAGTSDGAFDNLPVGTDGQVLTADSSEPTGLAWSTPSAGGAASPTDTAGWMPLTTVVGGSPELVWDANNNLIPTYGTF